MSKICGALIGCMLVMAAVGCGGSSSAAPAPTPTPTPSQIFANNQSIAQQPPISLGTSGGNSQDVGTKSCCIGTLGSLWTLTDNSTTPSTTKTVILSNNHVLNRSGNGVAGEAINQPLQLQCTAPSAPAPLTVAHLTLGTALKPPTNETTGPCSPSQDPTRAALCGHAPSNVDAAIAEIMPGQVDPSGSILDLGTVGTTTIGAAAASSTIGIPTLGEAVGKSGRTTGLTCSNIEALNLTILIDYDASCGATTAAFTAYYTGQISISGGSFSAGGDSGSLIVDSTNARPVGLLYGGSTTDTVANPIQDVINAVVQASGNNTNAFTIVGGADHTVSCARTTTVNSTQVGLAQSALVPAEQQRVTTVQQRRSAQLLHDASIKSVTIGASADNPKEGALLIHVSGSTIPQVAPVIDGVRTRVVFDTEVARPAVAQEAIAHANTVKEANVNSWMGQPGIQGMGVSQSMDNPAETAIAIYVIKGMAHPAIPAVMDGVRTRVFESTRFKAY